MKTFVTKPCLCPFCEHLVDRASSEDASSTRPSAGDVSLCIECGQVGVFSSRGMIEKPTAEQKCLLDADPRVTRARAIWSRRIAPLVSSATKPEGGRA